METSASMLTREPWHVRPMLKAGQVDLKSRFWSKVSIPESPDGCMEWQGARHREGYGKFGIGRATYRAHRVAYTLMVGELPEGQVLDHLCRNPACVRADHLEPVTQRVNVMRGTSFAARNAVKTHCPQGHEYTPENTLRKPQGYRVCRECNRDRSNAANLRRRGSHDDAA